MRLPNRYGSVVKLSGKRRKPYAVRITAGYTDYIVVPNKAEYYPFIDKYDMTFRKKTNDYIAESSDKILDDLNDQQLAYKPKTVQQFKYLEYFEKSADAYSYLALLNSGEKVEEHVSIASEPSFKAVYDQYIDFLYSLNNKPTESRIHSYYTGYRLWSDLHDLRFKTITTKMLQDCLTKHGNMSKSSVTRMITIIKAMYKYSIAHKICEEDYSRFLFTEYSKEKKFTHVPFTDDEIELIWKHTDDDIGKLVCILMYTGMRASELLRLETKNIHLKERYLVGGMKTEAGKNRSIPIHKDIVPLLRSLIKKGNKYLYPNQKGNPYSFVRFNDLKWKPFMKSIGLTHRTHDCRHTCATKLEAFGVSDLHRKLILGHTIRDITGGIYTHVDIKDLIKDIDKWPPKKH